ncbi:MAG: ComF family protein [Deltaproteobacteria bacterium]|nr:ComF family protein [Deltaproteobacteria bacterium]MBN2671218.1 ComF family protein [Deltaproteobacteria bacterium]
MPFQKREPPQTEPIRFFFIFFETDGWFGRYRHMEWKNIIESIVTGGLHFLFVPRCLACNALLAPTADATAVSNCFCSLCSNSLIPVADPRCSQCGELFHSGLQNHRCCACLTDPPDFVSLHAPFEYGGALADALRKFKYSNATYMAPRLAALLRMLSLPTADAVVPIPLHARRLRTRGYNQSALLAQSLAAQIQCAYLPLSLRRQHTVDVQVGKKKAERIQNMKNAFAIVDPKHRLSGRTVLLVDDVVTTTATVRAAAAALRHQANVSQIHVVCIGRTVSNT